MNRTLNIHPLGRCLGKQKTKYTDEFKREAVALVIEQGDTLGKAASSQNIPGLDAQGARPE
ncbi:TPA: transposase [Salmonella enterica subsp. enterica serovar Vietnam]